MLAYSRERKEVIETLPDEPAEGGEGWVYKTTEAGILAKIFKEPAAEHRREKVEALIASPPHDPPQAPDGHRRFAWPQEMLCDVKTGTFMGYTMAQILNGKPLDQFFDPGTSEYREKSFRVRLAIAVAELIADIHRHHLMLVVGDINPSNILADARGRVALIDLDSVQMTTPDGRNYPCPVGSTYYTPAELIGLGKKLGQVRRTREHDRFGLAAIIFQLLFNGCHPFAAVGNDCTPLDLIRAGDWPYANGTAYRPPPSAPPFRALPQAMQTIFTRTFVEGHWDPKARATAEEWVEALTRNEKALGRPPTAAPVLGSQVTPVARATHRGVTAYAAAAVVAVATLGFFGARWLHGESRAPELWRARMQGEPTAPQPEPKPQKLETKAAVAVVPGSEGKPVVWSSSTPALPPKPSYWDQVREQEERWEDEMSGLLKLVEEDQPAALRDPMKAVSACIEHAITRRNEPSPYMEQLLRRGNAIEAGMLRVEKMAHRLDDLLKRSPAPHRSPIDSRSLTERDMLWALATIRRDGGQKADAAYILQRVIQNEIKLIAGLPQELRNCNSCLCKHYHHSDFPDPDPACSCPSNFSETIQCAVELHEHVRERLSNSRARMLNESGAHPEPEIQKIESTKDEPDLDAVRRPTRAGSPDAPDAPKAGGVPIQPTRRQASFEPRPLPRPNLLVLETR